MEDAGTDEETPHIVKVRLRFVPGFSDENLDWPALRDEIPHCEVTKRLQRRRLGHIHGRPQAGLFSHRSVFARESTTLQDRAAIHIAPTAGRTIVPAEH